MTTITDNLTLNVSDGTAMQAFLARPDDAERHPGLILFQEAFGVNGHIRALADRLAKEGYVVLAPELYHRSAEPGLEIPYNDIQAAGPHREALTDEALEADIGAAYAALEEDAVVTKVGAVGFCMGGRVAFLANAVAPLSAAAAFYGGNIVPSLLPRAKDLHGPMLFFWGGQDKRIDKEQRRAIADALEGAGKAYTSVEFSEAGHAFFNDARPDAYDADAAREAWPLLLDFLETHLSR